MTRRVLLLIGVAALAVAVLVAISSTGTRAPSPEELARRVAACRVTWPNYPEDIKRQVGATPVARWRGEPESVDCAEGVIRVAFHIEGPWALRSVALPILLRGPWGSARQNREAACTGATVAYTFDVPEGDQESAPPWVEVKYPGAEKRLVLSADGSWRAH